MQFAIHAPAPPLREFIQCYWTLRAPASPPNTVFPDGCVEIVFQLADPMAEIVGTPRRQPRQILAGQMLRPVILASTGPIDSFGIRFKPSGASRILGFPLHEVENQILPLNDVWRTPLASRLADAPSTPERIRQADHFLLRSITPRPLPPAVRFALASSSTRTTDLARAAGVSPRHLERLFRDHVGTTPKMFARIRRFQWALQSLEYNSSAEAAAACGYFDQSHLIRDFQEFAGTTPAQYALRGVAFLQDSTTHAQLV